MKYRIWDIRNKEYNEDLMLDQDNDIYLCVGVPMNSHLSSGLVSTKYNSTNYILEISTGLKDKNGKEVYEGDIVKCGETNVFQTKTLIDVVKYDDREALFAVGNKGNLLQEYVFGTIYPLDDERYEVDIEVIGTIHDKED